MDSLPAAGRLSLRIACRLPAGYTRRFQLLAPVTVICSRNRVPGAGRKFITQFQIWVIDPVFALITDETDIGLVMDDDE